MARFSYTTRPHHSKDLRREIVIELRQFQQNDWDLLLDIANQAVPFAPQENVEWAKYRKAFDDVNRFRRHYIAVDNKTPVGYGCLEQQSDDRQWLRLFVVCSLEKLQGKIGSRLWEKLRQDAREFGASHLWARELQEDEPIREFLIGRGFVEIEQFTLPDKRPMVVYTLDLAK